MDGLQREENKAAQAEEMEALEAIYGDDYEFHPDGRYCEVTRTAAYRLEVNCLFEPRTVRNVCANL